MIDILQPYEAIDKKGFTSREISNLINMHLKSLKDVNPNEEYKELFFELVIFTLHENSDIWNRYYGPIFRIENKDGSFFENPSREAINEESILYWEGRIDQIQNPILKARYSGVVWDFKEQVTGKRPEINICIQHIRAIILTAKENYSNEVITTAEQLMRAVKLALTINNYSLASEAFDELINYEEKNSVDDLPGLWGFSMELLLENKKLRIDELQVEKVRKQMQDRFKRLINTYKGSDSDKIRTITLAGIYLCKFYNSVRLIDEVKHTIDEIFVIYQIEIKQSENVLMSIFYIEELMELYKLYGFNNEYQRLLVQLRSLAPEVNKIMTSIKTEFTIEWEKFEDYNKFFIQETLGDTLKTIPFGNIPQLSDLQEKTKYLREKNYLTLKLSSQIVDIKGRLICTIGGIDDDEEGQMYLRFKESMRFLNLYFEHLIKELKVNYELNTESLIAHISDSPLFDIDRIEIFKRSFDAYLKEDYLIFLHLIIPQIEDCCREIMEIHGENVLKVKEGKFGKSYQLKTFDEILRSEAIEKTFTKDQVFYLRAIFTDPRGFNLRNDICHGMSDFSDFNNLKANLTFNTVLFLFI